MKVSDLSVLYILEDEKNKEEVAAIVKKEVKKLFFATNINIAKQEYKKQSPCLLIIENSFKNKDIIDFLIEIRKEDIKTAFIIISEEKENLYLKELMELYITKFILKPICKEELSSALYKCMEIIQRRINSNIRLAKGIFFNFQTQSIIKGDNTYTLNKKESLLINYFIQNQNRIITYEELQYNIWNDVTTQDALKSLIRDFRKKTFKEIIKNYSGRGYKLEINTND